jgi:hypothetical protein
MPVGLKFPLAAFDALPRRVGPTRSFIDLQVVSSTRVVLHGHPVPGIRRNLDGSCGSGPRLNVDRAAADMQDSIVAAPAMMASPCLGGAQSIAYRNVAMRASPGFGLEADGKRKRLQFRHSLACAKSSKIVRYGAPLFNNLQCIGAQP